MIAQSLFIFSQKVSSCPFTASLLLPFPVLGNHHFTYGIVQCVVFWASLLSLSIVLLRSILYISCLFLLIPEECCIVHICPILFISSQISTDICSFQFLTITNKTAVNIQVSFSVCEHVFISLG